MASNERQSRRGASVRRRKHWLPGAGGLSTRLAYARARAAGVALDPILNKAGLTRQQVEDPSSRIGVHEQIRFLDLVGHALDDDLLGFHLAQAPDLREIGLFYYVLASSETLLEALQRAARYSSIANEGISLRCIAGDAIGTSFHYVGVSRHLDQHQIEFWMTALVRICRQLTGLHVLPSRVRLTHRRAWSEELASFLGDNIELGATADDIAFPERIRHAPVVSADLHLNKLLRSYCEEALSQKRRDRGSFRSRVENAIVPLLPHGKAQAGEVARQLGVGQRTLARRLVAEEVSFSEVLENLRSDLANRYLADPELAVSQIAWLLGYRDVGAFSHAFKRWVGKTPGQARREYTR
jgi:AraC-like DNA-binding protein